MIDSIMSTAVSGMETQARAVQQVAEQRANPQRALEGIERGHVDMTVAQHVYAANAQVVRTADEMLGTLLDVLA
jgi:flagellar hook-associated protein FlgK